MTTDSHSDHASVILDSITEGVFTVDLEWRITSFNRAAEQITGIARAQAIGRRCKEILRANICEGWCALAETIRNGQPLVNKRVVILDAQGRQKPISITTALLRDAAGQVMGGVETFRDLTWGPGDVPGKEFWHRRLDDVSHNPGPSPLRLVKRKCVSRALTSLA